MVRCRCAPVLPGPRRRLLHGPKLVGHMIGLLVEDHHVRERPRLPPARAAAIHLRHLGAFPDSQPRDLEPRWVFMIQVSFRGWKLSHNCGCSAFKPLPAGNQPFGRRGWKAGGAVAPPDFQRSSCSASGLVSRQRQMPRRLSTITKRGIRRTPRRASGVADHSRCASTRRSCACGGRRARSARRSRCHGATGERRARPASAGPPNVRQAAPAGGTLAISASSPAASSTSAGRTVRSSRT